MVTWDPQALEGSLGGGAEPPASPLSGLSVGTAAASLGDPAGCSVFLAKLLGFSPGKNREWTRQHLGYGSMTSEYLGGLIYLWILFHPTFTNFFFRGWLNHQSVFCFQLLCQLFVRGLFELSPVVQGLMTHYSILFCLTWNKNLYDQIHPTCRTCPLLLTFLWSYLSDRWA